MLYFNNNKFQLNDFKTFKEVKELRSTKQEVVTLIKKTLNIPNEYDIYFMNNIYETYALIIHCMIHSYKKINPIPNIITNKMEDPYILNILDHYRKNKEITVTYVKNNIYGMVNAAEVEKVIKEKQTCMIINSFVNLYTGSINNLEKIGAVAHKYKIPLFSDFSYAFGVFPFKPDKNNVDVLTFDMNYPGLSFLVINKKLLEGYDLSSYSIKLKGDVESHDINDVYIYGLAVNILETVYKNRKTKNKKLEKLKKQIFNSLKSLYYSEIIRSEIKPQFKDIIIFGHDIDKQTLSSPHILTIMCIRRDNSKKINKGGYTFCKINNKVFESIGIIPKWYDNIIVLGLHDYLKNQDINKIIKYIKSL